MPRCKTAVLLVGCWGALAALACDPVQDSLVASLGPEASGVSRGPNHRPGQPCLACHHDGGQARPSFSIAGTIYREKTAIVALADVDIELTDNAGHKFVARSNCAGNFYVGPDMFSPTFPVWVGLRDGSHSITMESPIYREGSCATCHSEPASPMSAGHVYLTDEPEKAALFPATPCRN